MPMERQAIRFNASLAHSVLQHEYLGSDDDHDDTKTSHIILAIVTRFPHKDTQTYTTDKFINCMAQ